MQRHTIAIQQGPRTRLVRVTYAHGKRDRQVPERAVRQALEKLFDVPTQAVSNAPSKSPISFLQPTPAPVSEQARPWEARRPAEQMGAIYAAWVWLVAQANPDLRNRAAKVSKVVRREIGSEEFTRVCDQLELSAHERLALLCPEPENL